VTGYSYALIGLSLIVRVLVSGKTREPDGSIDATPLVIILALALAGTVHLGDPLETYGLGMSSFLRCSWTPLVLLWAAAFVIGRVANAFILRPDTGFRAMLASGRASPGGVYLSLKDYPKLCGLLLGLPMICSQTFMEEFIFRGLLVSSGKWFYGLFGISPRIADFLSIMGSAVLFGLIHFIPAFCCLKGKSVAIPLYALIMPATLGAVLSALNQASCSLWPGWIVHFGLNYAGFMWDRISGKWETQGLK